MTIATLTLNPALDLTTSTDRVMDTHKLRCTVPRYDPGGGGINVARVIHRLGGEAVAVFPRGGPVGAMLEDLLHQAGVPIAPVAIAGATRESFTVDEGETGKQFRFVLPGATLAEEELAALMGALRAVDADYIVVSGSLPPGCDPRVIAQLAALAHEKGARLVVDTSGPALAACEGADVFLIKPSLREVRDLTGDAVEGEEAELAAVQALHARGLAEVIVLSLAERGALLVAQDFALRLPAISVDAKSAVGAGDSMVAAITLALARGKPLADALHYGIAAGAATLMTPGTELARADDVERLYAASSV